MSVDMFLKIDGTTYISNTNWQDALNSGPITLKAGPHTFDARFGNGVGGAGPTAPGNITSGFMGWDNNTGFIMRVDSGAGTSDPLASSTNVADYIQTTPVYPGAPLGRKRRSGPGGRDARRRPAALRDRQRGQCGWRPVHPSILSRPT